MPGFKFRPFSQKQLKAMTWWMGLAPYSDKDILITDGSIRSGKTVSMINGFIDWSLENFSDENFILAGKSMGALTKNVLNPLKKMLVTKDLPFYHVRSTAEPRLEIGSNDYYLYGANNKSSKDTLTGLTAAGSYADQVALFPENFVSTMIDRCSVEESRHWWNCNPQGPKHYVKTDYIDQAEEKNILRLHFNLDDNLTLSKKIKDRYKRLHSGVWYARYIEGKWVKAEGLVYDMFDEDKQLVSELPKMKKFWVGVDYGTVNPTHFNLLGLGKDNIFYLIDEWRHSGGKSGRSMTDVEYSQHLQDWLDGFKDEFSNFIPQWIFIDPSAKSFKTQVAQDTSFRISPNTDNSVLDGIRKIAKGLSLGKLKIHERCEHTIDEFHAYSWDDKAQEMGDDKPMKEDDHSLDSLRYIVNSIGDQYEQILRL